MASIAEREEVRCPEWTPEEMQAAEAFLVKRRNFILRRQAATLEVRIRPGDHDQWFLVGKQRMD